MRKSIWILVFARCFLFAMDEEPCCCPCENLVSQLTPSHTEGKGLGYTRGYTSLDLFLLRPFLDDHLVPFIDLKGHLFNTGTPAANAGFGFRWLDSCWGRIWGINAYYDYRLTSHRPYNGVALGLEFLGARWDVRINGYLPVGKKETPLLDFSYELSLDGYLATGKQQFVMKGVDSEVGYHLCSMKDFDFYAGAGPYVYWGRSAATENAFAPEHKYAIGGRLRASISVFNYFEFEGVGTYDSQFKWGGQGTFAIRIPLDFVFNRRDPGDCSCDASYCQRERLYQPVLRNEIMIVDSIERRTTNPNILDPEFEP